MSAEEEHVEGAVEFEVGGVSLVEPASRLERCAWVFAAA